MLEKIKQIALEAGEVIRDGFGTNFQIEYKTGENNLVTEIDKKSEKILLDFIKKTYPNHSILSEESGRTDKSSDFIWLIDPLDGTTNFAHGLPIFSVSIALQKKGETILGLVYDIMQNAIYAAESGSGAYKNEKRINVNSNRNLSQSVLVTGFPYDISTNHPNAVKIFEYFLKNSRAVRRLGSAAIDFCYVASGVFSGFWEVSLNAWDFGAGDLIVREAGGIVTDFSGKNLRINSKQTLATNGLLHGEMLNVLKNMH